MSEISTEIIQAAELFKTTMHINQATLDIPLTECTIYYIPRMPYSHRTYWTEEVLSIYYRVNNRDEYGIDVLKAGPKSRRSVYAWPFDTSPEYELKVFVSGNLQVDISDLQKQIDLGNNVMPTYYVIEPKLFVRILGLLAFS